MSDVNSPTERAWTAGTAPGIFPFLSHGIALARRPLEFLNSLPQHGDLVELRLGPRRAWMACHPELVHQVLRDSRTFDKGGPLYDRLGALMGDGLVTCRQNTHRRKRRMLQPAFRRSRITGYADLIAEEAEATCRTWQPGQDVPVSAEMTALTTRVISRVLLSDSLDEATAAEVRDCLTVVVRGLFIRTIAPVDAFFRLPLPANRRYRRAVDRVHAIIDAAIAGRTAGTPGDDVLGGLLAAGREEGTPAPTPGEIHDHLVTLLLTGVEAPALCLADAFALLARTPEAERRLHKEVDTVLDGRSRPTSADLPRLSYTRCVISETLRHTSPGWLFTRVTTRETELAGCRLPRGATVLYSPYLLHHAPGTFPEPERFLPERWLPGRPTAEQRRAWMPFSAGGRTCLGDEFSLMEATLVLATVAGHRRLRPLPGPAERQRPAITLGQRALVMTCEPRVRVPRPADAVSSDTASARTAGDGHVGHA
ncbi:cytochrome P450 [Streptomyces djakartensis]|uniref:cytochrome P450 n=1 Tax=Streptomyces djakartensis TaxID=68193 RepID=UPI0034DF8E29